jgi:hypothetical protein
VTLAPFLVACCKCQFAEQEVSKRRSIHFI